MSAICLIDTSIFLNLLRVPGRDSEFKKVANDFQEYVELGFTFILPMATILETGNHIAQNGNGAVRRCTAERFCEAIAGAFSGDAPWLPSEFPNNSEVTYWIHEFPRHAGQNKSPAKTTEGTSFGDLSIIKEYEKCLRKFSMSEVFIWSLDSDLCNYHRKL